MITQVIWTDVNNRELDNIYARMGDDEIREIQFIICRNDPPEKVAIPAGVSGQFRIVKSSGNFVVRNMTKTVKEDGTVIFTVSVSDQMVNVQGTGYYDIRLSGGGYLYTASGRFIVDTPVISTSVLEDVSEVNGLVFPDDFLTKEDAGVVIDDTEISTDSTWSSSKINTEIGDQIEAAIADIPIPTITWDIKTLNETEIGYDYLNNKPIYERWFISDNVSWTQGSHIITTDIKVTNVTPITIDMCYHLGGSLNRWMFPMMIQGGLQHRVDVYLGESELGMEISYDDTWLNERPLDKYRIRIRYTKVGD